MKAFFSWVPNFLTLCNLICGCLGIIFAFEGNFHLSFWMCISSAVFDFCDGFAARALKAYSPLGKELDSLADMVSFGLLPSVTMFTILQAQDLGLLSYIAFSIAAFSALRLAKFNIDENQTSEFIGLPTPACALFFVSYALIAQNIPFHSYWIDLTLSVIFALLLVSPIRMFSFKFKNASLKDNADKYIFAALSLLLIVFLREGALSVIIVGYIITNVIMAIIPRKR